MTWREMFTVPQEENVKSFLKFITSQWMNNESYIHSFNKMKTRQVTWVNWTEQGGVFTGLSVCKQDYIKTTEQTWMESKPRIYKGKDVLFYVSIHCFYMILYLAEVAWEKQKLNIAYILPLHPEEVLWIIYFTIIKKCNLIQINSITNLY